MHKRIYTHVVRLCDERGISIADLPARCNIAESTLPNLRYGKTARLRVSTVKKLCQGLSISLAEFYNFE